MNLVGIDWRVQTVYRGLRDKLGIGGSYIIYATTRQTNTLTQNNISTTLLGLLTAESFELR